MKIQKYLPLLLMAILFSCGKEFLEVKQNKSLVIPKAIPELQALLDDAAYIINFRSCNELGIIGSDEHVLADHVWANLPVKFPYEKKGYYWAKENVYEGMQVNDWDYTYKRILYTNTVLEGLEKIAPSPAEQKAWNNAKGSALFIRAFAFYQLAQEFCVPYNVLKADKDLGIPLRLKADITAKISRGTLKDTYNQIIKDLMLAAELLPNEPNVKYRPSKPAAYAVLARTYLQMGNYIEAGNFANLSLLLKNSLIDYNKININANYPFPLKMQDNPEILYISYILNIATVTTTRLSIDPELYLSYDNEDLGKKAYFTKKTDGTYGFKGSYYGAALPIFTGLAVDEVLLMRAECYARIGKLSEALEDLNYLMANRYNEDTFKRLNITNKDELLDKILDQRRKRLVLRGTRWEDLRRLNNEDRYKKILVRELNGIRYELLPGDLRYTWPIPDKSIEIGAYTQNLR